MDHKWTTNGPHFICGPSQRIKKLSSILTSTRFTLIDQIKRKAFFTVLFFREKSIERKGSQVADMASSATAGSSMSSKAETQDERKKRKNLEAKRKQLESARSYSGALKAFSYMVPLPDDDGYRFKVHGTPQKMCSPHAVTPGTRRSFMFTTCNAALQYLVSNGFDTKNHVFPVDEAQLATSHSKEDGWTQESVFKSTKRDRCLLTRTHTSQTTASLATSASQIIDGLWSERRETTVSHMSYEQIYTLPWVAPVYDSWPLESESWY